MHIIRTLAALALVPVLAAGGAASCSSNRPTAVCGTEIVEPVVSPDHQDSLEAVSHSECDHAPTTHTVKLYIEEQLPGGVWNSVEAYDRSLYTTCGEVPGPGHDTGCTRLVPCYDGNYRTRFTVYGTGVTQTGETESFSDEGTSATVAIECPA